MLTRKDGNGENILEIPDTVYELLERKHLSYDLQLVYDMAGRDVAISCLKFLPGMRVYIPMQNNLAGFLEVVIAELSKTRTVVQIAQTLRISPKRVSRILKKIKSK